MAGVRQNSDGSTISTKAVRTSRVVARDHQVFEGAKDAKGTSHSVKVPRKFKMFRENNLEPYPSRWFFLINKTF